MAKIYKNKQTNKQRIRNKIKSLKYKKPKKPTNITFEKYYDRKTVEDRIQKQRVIQQEGYFCFYK